MNRRSKLFAALGLALAACGGGTNPGTTTTPPAAAVGPAPAGDLSTADAVIEASLVAQGGRDKMAKVKSLKLTGALVISQMGIKGTLSALSAPPRNSLITIDIAGLGKTLQGVKDDVAWELNPGQGARIYSGNERVLQLREATFNADLSWKDLYPKVELAGVVDYNGAQAYKVLLTAKEGDTQTRYFAKDSLLPIGMEMTADTQMGKLPIAASLSDYREVNGIKYAYKVVRKEGPATVEVTLTTVEQDVAVPPTAFDLPPEVAALKR